MLHSIMRRASDAARSSSDISPGQRDWRTHMLRAGRGLLRPRWGIALVAGLLGALASLLVMGIFRLWWGTLTPPELVAERILPLIPADQFVALLARFKAHPKTDPLGLTLLGRTTAWTLRRTSRTCSQRRLLLPENPRRAPRKFPMNRFFLVNSRSVSQ